MSAVGYSPVATMAEIDALAATIPVNAFIQEAPMTIAQLHTNFAPVAGNRFKYARVTDLYSEVPASQGGVMINETGAHWQPLRPYRVGSFAGDANRTILPLLTPPEIILTGTLTLARTLNISNQYVYPGLRYHIKREAGGTLLGMVLSGLGISLGVNGWAIIEYDGTAWKNIASSGLL